ncbi:S-adenosyl-L-methionine-dependent tRNA 4-demethylwyosine synthase TYW1 isoform X2 [Nematostella vectensis]|uniref:S-adenosyl-L-methionine-dependent tRNA 4-demethylwyosine synthase TYW1 isoform X2 n=1 Tax=Nematostella vectensis TaxID=45351 RepID=UPI0020774DA4|nr:S-adenosyl-L-methionine-dependent tRNA 4-demethylwyosine synthase TYW1 isoform X2 [Nematostella vectensis]
MADERKARPFPFITWICLTLFGLLIIFVAVFEEHSEGKPAAAALRTVYSYWMQVRKSAYTLLFGGAVLVYIYGLAMGERREATAAPEATPSQTKQEVKEIKSKVSATLRIFYATQTGTAKKFSEELMKISMQQGMDCSCENLQGYEAEDNLANEKSTCVFIVPTYTDGKPPRGAEWFYSWLEDSTNDCRVSKSLLSQINYAVFGLGNSSYEGQFNLVAKNIDKWLSSLSAKRVMPVTLGDENTVNSRHGGLEADFQVWCKTFFSLVKSHTLCECGKQETCQETSKSQEETSQACDYESTSDGDSEDEDTADGLVDMEDLGPAVQKIKKAKKQREIEEDSHKNTVAKEMVTPVIRQSLTKQGYKIIGSHSGVKICRWTKSMLRGRGGCYKHTFYGIESHRCMETTPSLACANKCVFCWRHHTNPVGTEWRWQMDDPQMIVEGAMQNHYNMIKQFRGVPGVKPERFEEGMKIKHCALSLVGEPIMYPKINELIKLLHGHGISSFLVTNAQFPDAIKDLLPVTQLYVSVDAGTKESLKKIDRPLFRDFWPRFLDSLKALADKGQRTVYRLTLVKSWNVEEIQSYVELVSLGKPDFIEVKGVTYCGESKASTLTMANIPWHQEVVGFVRKLEDQLPDYELASEHEHSNCVLLAHKKFKVNGEWHTWIDYTKFHQLIEKYEESNGEETFTSADYMERNPEWSVFGHSQRGFDPEETRWYRKNRKDISGC